jgi:hypothetical protein
MLLPLLPLLLSLLLLPPLPEHPAAQSSKAKTRSALANLFILNISFFVIYEDIVSHKWDLTPC